MELLKDLHICKMYQNWTTSRILEAWQADV